MNSRNVEDVLEAGAAYPLHESEPDPNAISLHTNVNPFGTPPAAVDAIVESAAESWKYPAQAPRQLRGAIAEDVGLAVENVRLGNGSDQLLDLVCSAFLDPGERVVIPTPTFGVYELVVRLNGLEPAFVDITPPAFEWEVDELTEAIEDADAAFICRPNNPTGTSIDRDGLATLLETGRLIVVDEAYADFETETVADWVETYDNLIVTRTFSKLYGLAGLRIGYGLAHPKRIDTLGIVRGPYSVNRPAQAAALAALTDGKFVENTIAAIREGRERVTTALESIGFDVVPSQANFILASPMPCGVDGPALVEALADRDIIIRDVSGFRGLNEEWVRISIGRTEQNERLISAITDIIDTRQ